MKSEFVELNQALLDRRDSDGAECVGPSFRDADPSRQREVLFEAFCKDCLETAQACAEFMPRTQVYRALYMHIAELVGDCELPDTALALMASLDRLFECHKKFSETTELTQPPIKEGRLATTPGHGQNNSLKVPDLIMRAWVEAKAQKHNRAVLDAAHVLQALTDGGHLERLVGAYVRDTSTGKLANTNLLVEAVEHQEYERAKKLIRVIEPSAYTVARMFCKGWENLAQKQIIDQPRPGKETVDLTDPEQQVRTESAFGPERHRVAKKVFDVSEEADIRPLFPTNDKLRAVLAQDIFGLEKLPRLLSERSIDLGWYDFLDRIAEPMFKHSSTTRKEVLRGAFKARGNGMPDHKKTLQRLLLYLKDRGWLGRETFEAALQGALDGRFRPFFTRMLYRFYGGGQLQEPNKVQALIRQAEESRAERANSVLNNHNLTSNQYNKLIRETVAPEETDNPAELFRTLAQAENTPSQSECYHKLARKALQQDQIALFELLIKNWTTSGLRCSLSFLQALREYDRPDADYDPDQAVSDGHCFAGTVMIRNDIVPEGREGVDYCFRFFLDGDDFDLSSPCGLLIRRGFTPSPDCYQSLSPAAQEAVKENLPGRGRRVLEHLD